MTFIRKHVTCLCDVFHFKVCPGVDGKLHTNIVCPVDVSQQPEGTLPDIQSTKFAINFLKNYSLSQDTAVNQQPFFLAVGYHKPHIPLKYSKQFLDLYPLEKIHIASDPLLPEAMPSVAYEPWTDIRWRDDIADLNLSFPYGHMPDLHARKIIQSYFAATSYLDSLIGELLDALQEYGFANNTIVSFIGDHGKSEFHKALCKRRITLKSVECLSHILANWSISNNWFLLNW